MPLKKSENNNKKNLPTLIEKPFITLSLSTKSLNCVILFQQSAYSDDRTGVRRADVEARLCLWRQQRAPGARRETAEHVGASGRDRAGAEVRAHPQSQGGAGGAAGVSQRGAHAAVW